MPIKAVHTYQELLQNNRNWARAILKEDPDFFQTMASKQNPPFLYIGCSDSRMPLDTYTQTHPGEMFVHRNIANVVSLTDMNLLSVLEYALFQLRVSHVIVCGHHECGGIEAAYRGTATGIVDNWIRPVTDLILSNKKELDAIPDMKLRLQRVAELNVVRQLETLLKTSSMEKALADRDYYFQIHGWVLQLETGTIAELELPLEAWKEAGLLPQSYPGVKPEIGG